MPRPPPGGAGAAPVAGGAPDGGGTDAPLGAVGRATGGPAWAAGPWPRPPGPPGPCARATSAVAHVATQCGSRPFWANTGAAIETTRASATTRGISLITV